jgi:Protein similar to CwfJ C-terminus 1
VDKGAITSTHVLLLPIEHYPNTLTLSPGAWAELETYLSALRSCYAAQVTEKGMCHPRLSHSPCFPWLASTPWRCHGWCSGWPPSVGPLHCSPLQLAVQLDWNQWDMPGPN